MKWLKIFRGKSAADYESKGDGLAHDELWGEAKLAFEAGLDKLAREDAADPALGDRLRDKLGRCKESLAQDHYQEALTLTETGCLDEAGELLTVAADLTADADFKSALERKISEIGDREKMAVQVQFDEIHPPQPEDDLDNDAEAVEGYYEILLNALPEDVRDVYLSYGKNFEQGYLALNAGDFERAVKYLDLAAEENSSPQSLVPLELATAYVNLGQRNPARVLLDELIPHQPGCMPAYQLMCEIYWEEKQYDAALRLLDSLPPDLAGSMAACELRGGTLLQSERYADARGYFQDLLQNNSWRQSFAIGLATAHEKLGEPVEALDLYRELIGQCSGCGTRPDPAVKRKYADLSFAAGHYNQEVLEHYLELSRLDPANAVQYYQNVSRIYSELGNDAEAQRFRAIAERFIENGS